MPLNMDVVLNKEAVLGWITGRTRRPKLHVMVSVILWWFSFTMYSECSICMDSHELVMYTLWTRLVQDMNSSWTCLVQDMNSSWTYRVHSHVMNSSCKRHAQVNIVHSWSALHELVMFMSWTRHIHVMNSSCNVMNSSCSSWSRHVHVMNSSCSCHELVMFMSWSRHVLYMSWTRHVHSMNSCIMYARTRHVAGARRLFIMYSSCPRHICHILACFFLKMVHHFLFSSHKLLFYINKEIFNAQGILIDCIKWLRVTVFLVNIKSFWGYFLGGGW